MRVAAEHRGLGNSGPDHAAGQNQTLGESSARLGKIEPLDDIDVIDHAQSETDDLFVRHGNSKADGNATTHKPVATTATSRSRRRAPAARCLPESTRFRYDSRYSSEIAPKMDYRASSTRALGLEISE